MAEGTVQRIEQECDELGHVIRNGTVKIESLLRQIEEVVGLCRAAIEVTKAEIEAIRQEDI